MKKKPRLGIARLVSAAAAVGLIGCAPTLETPNDGPDAGPEEIDSLITHEDPGDGATITRVDARKATEWVYLSLASKESVTPAAPETSTEWDLGFRRFTIKLNGGVSGAGNVELTTLPSQDFDALALAPEAEYVTDEPDTSVEDGGDENEDPDYAFATGDSQWFDYNPMTHVLTPRDMVYVVRSTTGIYYKLAVMSYYDDAGASGYLTFRWQEIDAPPASTATR